MPFSVGTPVQVLASKTSENYSTATVLNVDDAGNFVEVKWTIAGYTEWVPADLVRENELLKGGRRSRSGKVMATSQNYEDVKKPAAKTKAKKSRTKAKAEDPPQKIVKPVSKSVPKPKKEEFIDIEDSGEDLAPVEKKKLKKSKDSVQEQVRGRRLRIWSRSTFV